MLQGAITAMVTPMNEDGSIDYDSMDKLIEFQINNGISGLVVLGSTGESATLLADEKFEVIHHVLKINNCRVKIIIGINLANTIEAVKCTTKLNDIPNIDYIMALTPYYIKPTQQGLYTHFASIAKISNKPIILYNVPIRTACDLQDNTTLALARDFKNIVGLKDATGDIARICYLNYHRPKRFMLFSGDDATSLAFMLCGGDGVISVVSNLVPNQVSNMCNMAIKGDKMTAIIANNKIIKLQSEMFIEANPIPVKWFLFHKGVISTPALRLPLTTLSTDGQVKVRDTIEQFCS
ncbi:MAG: 4-hydroxy-tetrahydrodipicolinate synthase [Burkholderiales bacterium]|nr:4-hydroxy-tetrahydrodipicolinate synthase [Burkholderiales bacterium]